MTESDWLSATDLAPMLEFLRDSASDRKLRLFACGCCRRVTHRMPDPRSRHAVEVTERFADGLATADELAAAHRAADAAAADADAGRRMDSGERAAVAASHPDRMSERGPFLYADLAAHHAASAASEHAELAGSNRRERKRNWRREWAAERAGLATLLRDVFGNPFKPVIFDPSWRTPTTMALARGVYESRDFSAMPVLADALEEAGCCDAMVLGHLRGEGPRVRGDWVVDLVLDKG